MEKVTSIIVDDDENCQFVLEQKIKKYCEGITVLGKADSVSSAITLINELKPDIVFLDVEMPTGSGFNLFKQIKKRDFHVIFVTAYHHYSIQAIRLAAMDYLVKPVSSNELSAAVERSKIAIGEAIRMQGYKKKWDLLYQNMHVDDIRKKRIALFTASGFELFQVQDILMCTSAGAYCRFHFTNSADLTVSKSLAHYKSVLEGAGFIRVSRFELVNINHIARYDKKNRDQMTVTLKGGRTIKVARRRISSVFSSLNLI